MGLKDRARGFFRRDNSRPNKKFSKRPDSRRESPPAKSPRDHMADIDGPVIPVELVPRLHSGGPRSVPNGSAKTKKSRRHSGHGTSRRTSNRRRSGSGHGKGHPVYRQHQRAKAGRKVDVQRRIAARK